MLKQQFCRRQVSATNESMYDDAFTLQRVEPLDISNFNYVAGMVPFLFNFIRDVSRKLCLCIVMLRSAQINANVLEHDSILRFYLLDCKL